MPRRGGLGPGLVGTTIGKFSIFPNSIQILAQPRGETHQVQARFELSVGFVSAQPALRGLHHDTGSETGRVLFLYTPAAAGGLIEALSDCRPNNADEHAKLFERHRWKVVGPNPL